MMRLTRLIWPKISDRWGLVLVLIAAFSLLIVGVGVAGYSERLYQDQKTRDTAVQAQILAGSVSAALAFDDRASAQEYVNALRANPEVETVAVHNDKGVLVASYERPGYAPGGAHITVTRPVIEAGTQLGRVTLRAGAEPLSRRLVRFGGLALLFIMASMLVAVLGAAQSALRRANRDLENHAGDLIRANEQLQVEMAERAKAEEALRQSQKMEAIGQLTGGVAHDFNNLLMIASSGLDLLERTTDPVRRERLKDGIRQAVDRGASLTRQLLAFSRRSALKPQVIDLAAQIETMRELLDRSLREDISVEIDLAPNLWPVEVDASQFELALVNTAVNARDAMPLGGHIVISAENLEGFDDGDLKGDYVRLSVGDSGVGMAPDVVARVFEPYFTTKTVGKGTGLGLSQVYGFSRASGGEVRIASTPGQGATVSFFLPRSHKPIAVAAVEAAPVRASARRRERILLVEDDDAVAGAVTEMLSELGFESVRAVNADAALTVLERDPRFQLVFSDMVMPGEMTGLDLAREIGRRRPDLPVLLTTGYSEAAAAAADEGMRLLPKPYRLDTLAAEIEAIRRRSTH